MPAPSSTPVPPRPDYAVTYPPEAYILHLSLAELALDLDTADNAGADLDIVRAYRQQQNTSALQPVIIMDYAVSDRKPHQFVLIPFSMQEDAFELSSLTDVMQRLKELPHTLYDVKLAVVSLAPSSLHALPQEAERRQVEEAIRPLLKTSAALPSMAQARIYLKLADYFRRHNDKEPAYICIENAKQSLAEVDENSDGGRSDSERDLLKAIDTQETLLHEAMPFFPNF